MLRTRIPYNRRIERTKSELRRILTRDRIPFAFLRGAAVAARYYKDPIFREYRDIDMLIPSDDFDIGDGVLLDNGFRLREKDSVRGARARFVGQIEYVHGETGIVVDVNTRLTGNGQIGNVSCDMDTLWGRAMKVAGETSEFELSAEDILLETVRHFAHGHDYSEGFLKACATLQDPGFGGHRATWHPWGDGR